MSRNDYEDTRYLSLFGKKLIENGYNIVPIPAGSKAPPFDGWQNKVATQRALNEWFESGYKDAGIGIITKNTPAIDLDIHDKDVAKEMQDWCELNIGAAPIRVGNFPKRILVFRTDEPFRKLKSGKWEDEFGDRHEIEILCDGQQFVAYGIHKDTHRPYEWTTKYDPTNTTADELPEITLLDCHALLDHFATVALERGWKKVTNGVTSITSVDGDDPFADVESIVDISSDHLRDKLMLVPGNEDHDTWVMIGMSLYHQFNGEDDGLKLWHEWSESADNYEPEVLDKRWKSFAIEGKGRKPVTARTILKLAKDAVEAGFIQLTAQLKSNFAEAKDEVQWREACRKVREADIDRFSRSTIAEIARQRYVDLTRIKISIAEVRRQLAFEIPANPKMPGWCKGWVYDAADDRFFHIEKKISMTMQSFNAVFSRQALTKQELAEGKTTPETTPVDLAMNVYRIPEVFGRQYQPSEGTIFSRDGIRIANSYPTFQIPALPDELRPLDKLAIRTVKEHIGHLLEDAEEQRLFMNWLAWIVQNPGKLLKWAMVLQGVEGDGKSFWAFLLSAVMGPSNVRMLNAHVLEGSFTGWAHGQCVIVVEEPRLQGHNKYDVINRIKPLITNPIVEVHPKGKDPYNVDNTSNYYIPTNFRDALPINSNDRRYAVLFSRWQQRDALREFCEKNPDYYVELYRSIEQCAPAIRKWLLEHDVDEDFPAGRDAPRTKAHNYMVKASQPDFIRELESVIADDVHPEVSELLINATAVGDAMIGRDFEIPATRTLHNLLEHNGYVYLGRVKVSTDQWGRFWTKRPDLFRESGETSPSRIRHFLKKRYEEAAEKNEL